MFDAHIKESVHENLSHKLNNIADYNIDSQLWGELYRTLWLPDYQEINDQLIAEIISELYNRA